MTVADRLAPFGTTIFAEMSRLALEHSAVNLSQGFPDFDGPAHVKQAAIDAIRAGTPAHCQYAPLPGVPVFINAIAKKFDAATGFTTDPTAQVTVTTGCTEAIAASLLGLINPGDEVILFEPYYDSYRACVAMAGATARFITLRAPEFTFDPADLDRAITKKTRAILVNTPHNPTGRVFSQEEMQAIADRCIKHNLICLTDEVYEHLAYDAAHIRMATLPGMAERTVTMSSLGKTFSLTGWKIGWTIAPPKLTQGIRAAHQFLTFVVSSPMQHAGAVALNSPQRYFDELRASFINKRDLLASALRDIGFEFHTPEGGYFIYADHRPVSKPLGIDSDVELCQYFIEIIKVAAIPPSFFYNTPAHGKDLIRFAFCKKEDTLREAVRRLGAIKTM